MVATSGALPPLTALDSLVTPSGPAGTMENFTLMSVCVLLNASAVSLAPAVADQKVRVTGLPSPPPEASDPDPPQAVASRASEARKPRGRDGTCGRYRAWAGSYETSNCGR